MFCRVSENGCCWTFNSSVCQVAVNHYECVLRCKHILNNFYSLVLEGKGDGSFDDISSLTIFADYRIPQVLVHLKAMKYSEELMKKLREGTLFQSGDKEEVEIRGCSIWCCALICKHLQELYQKKGQDMHERINAVLLDYYLWDYARDHREEMKDIPFHRVRCIYY
uniref:Queuosine 5'-phosphate N-glycosylase/hydrolase n=1 Tax=Corvus moneduloides TaxID=1196302 RepID=A0A8U7NLY8_CORMO